MDSCNVQKHSVHTLVFRSLKRTHDMFLANQSLLPPVDPAIEKLRRSIKAKDSYKTVLHEVDLENEMIKRRKANDPSSVATQEESPISNSLALVSSNATTENAVSNIISNPIKKTPTMAKPKWHAPWKLYRVISGHLGWVRCCAVEPGNEWFATGSADRIIKVWDLASGQLKISLTGHISSVRGLAFSPRHPYLFSCGEDKQVKCWDLEYNKVIRHYHGHLSAVYSLALHPTIDVLVTAGRDCTARVWDMRTKVNVHTLSGHTNTIASVVCQATDPQVITGSHDSTIRLYDLAAGKSRATLTNHKKSVRALTFHPTLNMFASGSPDNIKQWKADDGKFIQNLSGHNAIINCLAANEDGVLVSGADNGTMHLWDWRTGYNFQRLQAPVQPGSMDSEAGVFSVTFDHSGTRMITTEADKTIKIYKEDDTASEETHPINWKPEIIKRRKY
ncbi:pleiotropic regulator 1-like [Trichogramma pretiosum]|uniref:pleiotropic regulator 1-like n=1 Tax=Trichogramma pretiosum TaxID=7493 RepID=UPI0006C9C57B|nr:pleiotropic regulator 1-like [Trichogramma pretiosum]